MLKFICSPRGCRRQEKGGAGVGEIPFAGRSLRLAHLGVISKDGLFLETMVLFGTPIILGYYFFLLPHGAVQGFKGNLSDVIDVAFLQSACETYFSTQTAFWEK